MYVVQNGGLYRKFFLQVNAKWHEKDNKLIATTDNVDYDIEGMILELVSY